MTAPALASAVQERSVETLTFGCRLNIAESEQMRAAAIAAGESNLLIVNTCAVTEEAARQSLRAIRRAKRAQPERQVVATGCAAEIERDRFARAPIDRFIPNADKLRAWGGARPSFPAAARDSAHTRVFVDVQTGCDHRCTFCVIPYGRGPSRSRPAAEILAMVGRSLAEGRKEIVLTGVDLTSWGVDLPSPLRLGGLVREILARYPALVRLRLSSIDCVEIDSDLMDLLGSHPRLMPHVHLSLQSGSDLILKRMRRRHRRADAIDVCQRLRRARPDAAIGADLIVGFPTETEAMFQDTLSLVEACGLSFLHVFPFSPRPGAPAARMPQVDPETVRDRACRLRAMGDAVLSDRLRASVGRTLSVLVERGDRGHAPDFSLVRLPQGSPPGALIEVLIAGATHRELIGNLPPSRAPEAARAYGAGAMR